MADIKASKVFSFTEVPNQNHMAMHDHVTHEERMVPMSHSETLEKNVENYIMDNGVAVNAFGYTTNGTKLLVMVPMETVLIKKEGY